MAERERCGTPNNRMSSSVELLVCYEVLVCGRSWVLAQTRAINKNFSSCQETGKVFLFLSALLFQIINSEVHVGKCKFLIGCRKSTTSGKSGSPSSWRKSILLLRSVCTFIRNQHTTKERKISYKQFLRNQAFI